MQTSDEKKRGAGCKMKKINVRFEIDAALKEIDVLVRAPERDGQAEALMERITGHPPDMLTAADSSGSLIRIDPRDVISVSISGKQAQIVTQSGRYTVRQPLQSLESRLDSLNFVRISRYEIVNLDKVSKFDFTLGGTLRLELAGGMETWASRRNIPAIRKKLMERG